MKTLESSDRFSTEKVSARPGVFTLALRQHIDDPRWQLALRIAASPSLRRSRLMVDFLLYVVDRQIHDRSDEITEPQIGVLVFGRPEGYDTNEDNIVRSYARHLRKRIEEYYAGEGVEEDLLLEIPRGGYTPIFALRSPTTEDTTISSRVEPDPASETADLFTNRNTASAEGVEKSARHSTEKPWSTIFAVVRTRIGDSVHWNSRLFTLCAGLLIGILVAASFPRARFNRIFASSAETESRMLFSQLFNDKSNTFIVPSDDGLVIMQRLTERPVPLASYINGSYRPKIKIGGDPADEEIIKLGGRRYTSVVDLELTSRLTQLSEIVPEHMFIRYARDLRMEDIRNGNAVFIGSVEANPWIELFQPQLPLRFNIHPGDDKASGILNTHPRPREATIYGTSEGNHTYGFIAYVPNLNATGHVLIVAGLNTAGTEAAATFLLNPTLMAPILKRAKLRGDGFQSFQVLIGAGNVASNAATPQMVLERIGL
jgi:hypothetical protein